MKKDRWSGDRVLGIPSRERPLVGVIPPLVKPTSAPVDERRFINEQTIRHVGAEPYHDPYSQKGSIFESKIKAERPNNTFNVVEITLPLSKPSLRDTATYQSPPSTPKPLRRTMPKQKKLLSQSIIFLHDNSNTNCKL